MPEGQSVFTQFRVFPISTSVEITVYQYGKNVLYFFYNIAQRNIKKEISVLTLSYINTALSQSAFRIYKCYIIKVFTNFVHEALEILAVVSSLDCYLLLANQCSEFTNAIL